MSARTFYEIFQPEKYGNILKPVESLHSVEDIEAKSETANWIMRERELDTIQTAEDNK